MKNQEVVKVVVVNPVPRISVQGRHKQVFTMVSNTGELIPTKNMNKTKEPDVPTVYTFMLDSERGKLITGLEEQIINPFKDREMGELMQEFNLPNAWIDILHNIVNQDKITLQTYYEILDGVDPDKYTSKSGASIFDYKGSLKEAPEPTFLEKFQVILYDYPNRFIDDNTVRTSRQRLAIQLIKNHNKISASRNGVNESIHAFYISEENESEKMLNKKRDVIKKGIKALGTLQEKHTDYMQHKVASLLTYVNNKPVIKEKVNSERLKAVLDDYIMDDGNNQLNYIDKFLTIYGLTDSVEGTIKLNIMYLIQSALNTVVMSIRDGNYIWHSKSDVPNVYKFNNYEKMLSFFITEYKQYNSKDKSISNWYKELLDEVRTKDVWLEEK